jgi:hypothetical protein
MPTPTKIKINRAPVLTLWAVVVAERLGYSRDSALTLGKAVAGMSAFAKAKSLGLAEDRDTDLGSRTKAREKKETAVAFMGRRIPVADSPSGPLALADGKPVAPKSVEKYLTSKFGDNLKGVTSAMAELARSVPRETLIREGFRLYEKFRPEIPAGVEGWGKTGVLDLALIARLARKGPKSDRVAQHQIVALGSYGSIIRPIVRICVGIRGPSDSCAYRSARIDSECAR